MPRTTQIFIRLPSDSLWVKSEAETFGIITEDEEVSSPQILTISWRDQNKSFARNLVNTVHFLYLCFSFAGFWFLKIE